MPGASAPDYMRSNSISSYYLGIICRRCSGFSSATIYAMNTSHVSIASALSHVNSSVDITANISKLIAQSPKLQTDISGHVPDSVRDALLDAYDSQRPRARCAHFRTTVEFALREAKITVVPGKTLGAILKEAERSFALPPALIELCDQVKAFGNWGLHWAEANVEDEDAEAAQKITEAIINYLFELPALVQAAKLRIDEAKSAHHNA